MKIHLKWFGGMVPRQGEQHMQQQRLRQTGFFATGQQPRNTDYDQGSMATDAENTSLYSGELRPLVEPALAHVFCQPGDPCWFEPQPGDPGPPVPPEPPVCIPVAFSTAIYPDVFLSFPTYTGQEVTLTADVNSDATVPVYYQWYKNGMAMPGEVGPTYTFTLTPEESYTTYSLSVRNPCGQEATPEYPIGEVVEQGPLTVTTLYDSGLQYSGYGQDQFLSDGLTTNGSWMVNHRGNGDTLITTDNGQTFSTYNIQPSTGSRVIQKMDQFYDGVWMVNQYRSDIREHRLWWSDATVTIPTGGWNFNSKDSYTYSHGHAINFSTKEVIAREGNNNDRDNLTSYTEWYPDNNTVFTDGGVPVGNETERSSGWHTFLEISGDRLWYAFGDQGGPCVHYTVWNSSTLAHQTTHEDILFNGRTAAQHRSTEVIKSTGSVSNGAITGGVVTVQTWGQLGVTTDTAIFSENVDYACMHTTADNKWFMTAFPTADNNRMFILKGDSGTDYVSIDLPHPRDNYSYRSMRYIGGDEWIIAYLATVGATVNSVVVIKVTGL